RRHDDPKYERFALELGAERFLAKSVPPEALLAALDELVVNNAPKAGADGKLPVLDESAIERAVVRQKAQKAQADLEKAQQAQKAQALEQAQKAQAEA